ncbi:MAG: hypothetical protein U1E76_21045 [Planctomycetota bacterium]
MMMILGFASALEKRIERHQARSQQRDCRPVPPPVRSSPATRKLDQAMDELTRNYEAASSAVAHLDQSIRSMEQLVRQAERSREKAAAAGGDRQIAEIYERNLVELNEQLQATQLQRAKLCGQRDRLKAGQVALDMRRRLIAEGASEETLRLLSLERPSPVDQLDRVDQAEGRARAPSSVIVLQ